jgi:hypothetical protein
MKKRQKKKNATKYLVFVADEFPLMTWPKNLVQEEIERGDNYWKKYGFRKSYRDLKREKFLRYHYRYYHDESKKKCSEACRSKKERFREVTQNLSDLAKAYG